MLKPENKRVKELRKFLKLKQGDFAKTIGLSQGTWSGIERGESGVTADHLKTLNKKFDANPNWVLLGYGKMFLSEINSDTLDNEDQKLKDEFEQMKDQMNGFASTIKKITNFIGLDT